jgi:hypothetical protein
MSFESDLRTYLIAAESPANAVQALISTRMYPVVLPQNVTFPAASYTTISAVRGHTMQGPDNLPAQRVQIDAWALTYAQARALADAIRERIDGFRDAMGSTAVQGIFFDTERHLHETDDSTHIFRISQDFICWFEEG